MRVIGGIVVYALFCLILAIVALLVIFRFGPGRTEAVAAPGMQDSSLEVEGAYRTFSICLPNSFKQGKRYPIVVMLHGGGFGSGQMLARQTGACDYVDRHQFIAVFPNAEGRHWNDGRSTTAMNGNDVLFLKALVAHVGYVYGGDPTRAFVAGISNGGMMALRMACQATDLFRAYVAVVANLPEELSARCRPSRPVPVLFILSRDDPGMPWNGGELGGGHLLGPAARQHIGAGGRVMSAPDTVSFFAGINGCSGESVLDLPDRAHDGTSVRVHTLRCSGSPVVLYEIQGGGHGWPGSRFERGPRLNQLFGVVSREIDATEVMVDFFRKNGL